MSRAIRRIVDAELAPDGPMSRAELRRLFDNEASRARLEQFGSPLGQLLLAGKIDAEHYAAGRQWDQLARAYGRSIDAPGDPRSLRVAAKSALAPVVVARAVDSAAQERFSDALAFLARAGPQMVATVRQCCEGNGRYPVGYQELMRLCGGLAMLARRWRLTG